MACTGHLCKRRGVGTGIRRRGKVHRFWRLCGETCRPRAACGAVCPPGRGGQAHRAAVPVRAHAPRRRFPRGQIYGHAVPRHVAVCALFFRIGVRRAGTDGAGRRAPPLFRRRCALCRLRLLFPLPHPQQTTRLVRSRRKTAGPRRRGVRPVPEYLFHDRQRRYPLRRTG